MEELKVLTVVFRTPGDIRFGEMVFIDGQPHLVWDWEGDQPLTMTPLDPQYLTTTAGHVPPGADAAYSREVEDPRRLL